MMKKIVLGLSLTAAAVFLAYAIWHVLAAKHVTTNAPDLAMMPARDYGAIARVVLAEDLLIQGYDATAVLEPLAAAGLGITILSGQSWQSLAADPSYAIKEWSTTLQKAASFRLPAVESMLLREFGPLIRIGRQTGLPRQDLRYFAAAENTQIPDLAPALSPALGGQSQHLPYAHNGANLLASQYFCLMGQDSPSDSFDVYPGIPAALFQKDSACPRVLLIPQPPHPLIDRYALLVNDQVAFVAELRDDTLAAVYPDASMMPPEWKVLQRRLDEVATSISQVAKVERLPLPLPHRGVWRSYTSAFLANGIAVLPRYRQFAWGHGSYPDQALQGNYETLVETAFHRHGYRVIWAAGDALAYNGASWRSVLIGAPDHDTMLLARGKKSSL